MATTEKDVLLNNIDEAGDVHLLYPVTKVKNVIGGADVDTYTTTLTAAEFEALTTAEKIALFESGVRVIVAGGYGYTIDSAGTTTPVNAADAQKLDGKPASDFVQTANVVNNFTTTEEGFVADARTVAELNSNIASIPGSESVSSYETYSFPTSNAAISNNNNKYTVLHSGIAFVKIAFSNMAFSQISISLNNIKITDGMITSGENTLKGATIVIPFPVRKDDIITVIFYSTYTVNEASLKILY